MILSATLSRSHSSRGLGRGPLKAETGVRVPYGATKAAQVSGFLLFWVRFSHYSVISALITGNCLMGFWPGLRLSTLECVLVIIKVSNEQRRVV